VGQSTCDIFNGNKHETNAAVFILKKKKKLHKGKQTLILPMAS